MNAFFRSCWLLTTTLNLVGVCLPVYAIQPESALNAPERRELPEFSAPEISNEPIKPVLPPLPALPPITDDAPLSAVPQVFVKKFVFVGNTVFSEETLSKVVEAYQNRKISAEELQEAKNEVTRYYIEKGYINSGAIIPDQPVKEGIITLQVIEGQLSQVVINGNDYTNENYLRQRLENQVGDVLNINELQKKLQLLQQNPLIKRVNAELGPGVRLGEGVLTVNVEENRPYTFGLIFNNHRSPSIGSYRGELEAQHINLTGRGDQFYARYGLTEGLDDWAMSYKIPLNRYDTSLSVNIERSDSQVIEEPFSQLNVKSEADTYSLTLSHPFYRVANQEFTLGLRLEKRSSQTYLLDQRFSFSPGVHDGESKITVVRFSQDWLDRSRVHVIAARSSFNVGIDALDATINEDGSPDGKFFTWLGQFQYVRRLDFFDTTMLKDSQILFRSDLQYAHQELLPLEKFSIGGASTVRGYRENQLTRDNGFIASIEWRLPLTSLRIPKISREPDDGLIQLAPFFDYGRSWNSGSTATPEPKDISSIGLGLRWAPSQKVRAEVYWGHALRNIDGGDEYDLQDDGVHFELSMHY
ncbi:hemolysin activation/secretion protein [Beggiatoa alba B18LD]|uniref:Hemolysin activation/secretion protein n=1 Tax=Beggiatoa alba B18LD TaxID=395493 RepID=I3CHX2_9GAMM|nr:ShlB/FhaC/HecB family hemolysin secretion/activation protein [Beggiatoa alba]EIJ43215.1 hemolysin activation/secretion protein [Beggiatoa alba B18LD]